MITFRTEVKVKGISGDRVSEFMLNCSDEAYQRWWPGVHLAFHPIKARAGHTGSLVYFDEYIGTSRMRFAA
ncbi:MAG: hypothetical protein K6U03_00285 [Firmicutes bacterium]|nr:hypothetical protein [Bacillota bacterium]